MQIITSLDANFTKGVVDHGIFNLRVVANHNPTQVLPISPVLAQCIKLTNFAVNNQTDVYVEKVSSDDLRRDRAINLYASLSGVGGSFSISA